MRNSVLIIGGGGREHSLAVAMMNSPQVVKVYMDSRNAACEKFALPVPPYDNYDELATFCRQQNIALVIIGPEAPLAEGVADILRAAGVAVFGPSQKAAKIEYSKIYAKNLMRKHNIATPDFAECENFAQVAKWCAARRPPYVIKADSLAAAGKGVFICDNAQMAQEAAAQILGGKCAAFCEGPKTATPAAAKYRRNACWRKNIAAAMKQVLSLSATAKVANSIIVIVRRHRQCKLFASGIAGIHINFHHLRRVHHRNRQRMLPPPAADNQN